MIRNVPSNFPNECSAFETLSVKWNVPSNFPQDWTPFIKESGNDARESKWYTDFPFIPVKTRKRGALLKIFHFSEKCPVEKPGLLVSRRKNQFFPANGSLSPKSPKKV